MTYENWKVSIRECQENQELQDEYETVANWCTNSGKYQIQEVGDEYCVVKLFEPLPPTYEEVRQVRENLYRKYKDPITCQIQSLRDEEQTEEVIAEIEALKIKRAEIVAEIKANNPYPEENADA